MPTGQFPADMPSSNFQGDEMAAQEDMMQADDTENQFDTNFDAGVQADEESDPEKYIQQLTGKLCTTLDKFNEDRPTPDTSLNKYVAGMVISQCVKGLSEKERNAIIKKLTDSEDKEEEANETESQEQTGEEEEVATVQQNTEQKAAPEMNEDKMVEMIMADIKRENESKPSKHNTQKSYKTSPYMIK